MIIDKFNEFESVGKCFRMKNCFSKNLAHFEGRSVKTSVIFHYSTAMLLFFEEKKNPFQLIPMRRSYNDDLHKPITWFRQLLYFAVESKSRNKKMKKEKTASETSPMQNVEIDSVFIFFSATIKPTRLNNSSQWIYNKKLATHFSRGKDHFVHLALWQPNFVQLLFFSLSLQLISCGSINPREKQKKNKIQRYQWGQ